MAWSRSGSALSLSKWSGKVWNVLGDSNSYNANVKTYHEIIKETINCTVNNHARGGAGWIAKGSGGVTPNVSEQLASASATADLITAMAGGNDYDIGYPLGVMGDTTMDTFYGALDYTINALITKYPSKIIAVFAQMRRDSEVPNAAGVTVEQQVNATIEVCKKYSLPVLNLYHHGNLHPWNATHKAEIMPDGVHLSNSGQQMIARKIRSFIESL